GVNIHAVNALLFGHLEQRVEVSLLGVNASVGHKAKQVQPAAAGAGMLQGGDQGGVGEEVAVLDHQVDAGDVHVDDAAGADIEVADFAVSHLAVRETNEWSAGVNERVGIFAQQTVVGGLVGEGDRVGFSLGAIAPSVKDDEDERFRTGHFSNRSCSSFELSISK